jgi:ATP-dependent DNA helicase RecQ
MHAARARSISDADLLQVLRSRFGHSGFRPGQMECIRRTLDGIDQLMVLPTGGGKSLLYQMPACTMQGMTLVISPLVALMEDQLRGLARAGISAACLHAGQPAQVQTATLASAAEGRLKVLLAAPERLTTRRFQSAMSRARVELAAVDEAHCVSEWGHDFRPDYRQLRPVLARMRCVILAITATATEEVQNDICAALGIPDAVRTVLGVDRENLRFGVRPVRDEAERIDALAGLAERFDGRSGLIYVSTRREADDLAFRLCRRMRERVSSYHAGLPADVRQRRQEAFVSGTLRVLVATSAFGMGIDKPDVRFVLHAQPPRSLEDYVQEAGRASRDGQAAVCAMVSAPQDIARMHQELERCELSEARTSVRRRRLLQMQSYVLGRGCRRVTLVSHFGGTLRNRPTPCCDRCNRFRWEWLRGLNDRRPGNTGTAGRGARS